MITTIFPKAIALQNGENFTRLSISSGVEIHHIINDNLFGVDISESRAKIGDSLS